MGCYKGQKIGTSECAYKRENCFAYDHGECTILSSEMTSTECPFFKTRKQFEDGLKKHPYIPPDPGQHSQGKSMTKKVAHVREVKLGD